MEGRTGKTLWKQKLVWKGKHSETHPASPPHQKPQLTPHHHTPTHAVPCPLYTCPTHLPHTSATPLPAHTHTCTLCPALCPHPTRTAIPHHYSLLSLSPSLYMPLYLLHTLLHTHTLTAHTLYHIYLAEWGKIYARDMSLYILLLCLIPISYLLFSYLLKLLAWCGMRRKRTEQE